MDIKRKIKKAQAELGIEQLKKYQIDPINSILDQEDTFVVVPPSEEKSAIYQVPALISIPYREKGISIISIVLDAPPDTISSLSGKLGMLDGVSTKTIFSRRS